jgi:hypothetical protein
MYPLKYIALAFLFLFPFALQAQKHFYDVELFGKKIGSTVVERIDKGNGEIEYKLNSHTEVNILFTHKTSVMSTDVVYKNGQLISSYVKNVKDDVTEVASVIWDGAKYVIKRGEESLTFTQPIDFSTILLYFFEPKGRKQIFSERLGQLCGFTNPGTDAFECKLDNGVDNIYRYKNGIMYELEMSKGASVFMRLVK